MSPHLPRLCPLSCLYPRVGTAAFTLSLWDLQPTCRQESSPHVLYVLCVSPLQGKAQQQQSQAPQRPKLEARSPPQREALVRAPAGRTRGGDSFHSISDRLCEVPVLSHVCWHGDAGLCAHCPLASCVPVSTLTGTVHDMTKEPFPIWACVSAQDTTSTAPTSPTPEKMHPKLGAHWCLAHIRLRTGPSSALAAVEDCNNPR